MKEKNEKLSTEEKMIKNFEVCRDFIDALQILIIFVIIFFIISFINDFSQAKFDANKMKDITLKLIGYDEKDYIEYVENFNNDLTVSKNVFENQFIIGFIIRGISLLAMVKLLSNMLTDAIKQKTPFVEKNINRMKLIAICSFLYSYKLIYLIIIVMVNQLFKYGYKLQAESDELL